MMKGPSLLCGGHVRVVDAVTTSAQALGFYFFKGESVCEEHLRMGGVERKRDRENPKQAPCCQCKAQCSSQTHEP